MSVWSMPASFDELVVRLERRGWRLVGRVRVVREPLLVIREKVNMRVDERAFRSGRRRHDCRMSLLGTVVGSREGLFHTSDNGLFRRD